MIILIGGTSCTGKTFLAQKLLEKYRIPYFSIDHLKMGIYRSDRDCGFTPLDEDEIITEKLWPIIREMIKTMIENNQSGIIEGCYLLPEQVEALRNKYPEDIISFYLIFSTPYIREHFDSGIIKYRNVIENRGAKEDRPITQFIEEHDKLKRKCIQNDAKYFEIEQNYEEEMMFVYQFIEEKGH